MSVPLFGDLENNFLMFLVPSQPDNFRKEFIKNAPTYGEIQWVFDFYKDAQFKPVANHIKISDYAHLRQTHRNEFASTRISIDTTLRVETFPIHPDRERETGTKFQNWIMTILLSHLNRLMRQTSL